MRVLVAAGGSGGHVYPALAVLEELQRMGELSAAAWVGTEKGIERKILSRLPWIDFYPLPCRGLQRSRPWSWPGSLWANLFSLVRAVKVLHKFHPDVVLGMGGYPALAPLLAAALLHIPRAIHEQNAYMGLANRLLALLADRVFLSFPKTGGVPVRKKVLVTGNPVRREFLTQGTGPKAQELLIVGGSQGSRTLVEATLRAAKALAQLGGLRIRMQVGNAADPDWVKRRLEEAGLSDARVEKYVDRMAEALAQARLVIARAGATTVAELAATGRPSILVPWAGAAGDHQSGNAQALAKEGGCVLVPERKLKEMDLGKLILKLWMDEEKLCRMARAVRRVARPEAAKTVAQELLALAKGSR